MTTTLRDLLTAVGPRLLDVVSAPRGLDVPVTGVVIVDPDDAPDEHPGALVLAIGVRGAAALPLVRAAAAGQAAAVAVKGAVDAPQAGTAVLDVAPDIRWDRLETLVTGVLDAGGVSGPDDLFALAQTVALLTDGIVSIEDTASRVLAYSRSDGDEAEADELRRLSILGRQGPPAYLRHLHAWGVFDRLRTTEDVVTVEEHAELGVRRRLAVGIHAGPRVLGTIWVQEGARPLSTRAPDVLVGAARVAAGHLVRRRRAAPTWHRDLVEGLLDGTAEPGVVASTFGLDAAAPAVVVGFASRSGEGVTRELSTAELADVVAVHAAGYRRAALTAWRDGTVYAVLPGVADGTDRTLRVLCAEIVAVTGRRTGVRVQAGIGSSASAGLAGVPASRSEADRVLATMAPATDVAAFADLRAEVLLGETLSHLRARPDLRDPAVEALVAYDRDHGGDLAGSVLAWLDALGDVRAAADLLTVHPNTLRYRVRRAVAVAGLQLEEPRARLVHHLALVAVRSDKTTGPR